MKNYRYVSEYDSQNIDNLDQIIRKALYNSWLCTPSKNNFMPYKIHVLDTTYFKTKELLYYKCLQNETKANGNELTTIEELKNYEKVKYSKYNPQFFNLKNAPYVLIFTSRVATELNDLQQELVNDGFVYEQMAKSGEKRENAQKVARIEIGIFSANFSSACLNEGIDVSYTLCFPNNKNNYLEPEFDFLDENPILIMSAGRAKTVRRDFLGPYKDLKPDFNKVVHFVGEK